MKSMDIYKVVMIVLIGSQLTQCQPVKQSQDPRERAKFVHVIRYPAESIYGGNMLKIQVRNEYGGLSTVKLRVAGKIPRKDYFQVGDTIVGTQNPNYIRESILNPIKARDIIIEGKER